MGALSRGKGASRDELLRVRPVFPRACGTAQQDQRAARGDSSRAEVTAEHGACSLLSCAGQGPLAVTAIYRRAPPPSALLIINPASPAVKHVSAGTRVAGVARPGAVGGAARPIRRVGGPRAASWQGSMLRRQDGAMTHPAVRALTIRQPRGLGSCLRGHGRREPPLADLIPRASADPRGEGGRPRWFRQGPLDDGRPGCVRAA